MSQRYNSDYNRRGSRRALLTVLQTPFPGAKKYRYLDKDEYKYLYANINPRLGYALALGILLLFAGIVGWLVAYNNQKDDSHVSVNMDNNRIVPHYESPDTHIQDGLGIVTSSAELEDALSSFEKDSGVCPVFYTIDKASLKVAGEENTYLDVYSYAKTLQDENYPDRQHMIIVFASTEEGKASAPYEFDVFVGEEAGNALSDKDVNSFKNGVLRNLQDGISPDNAVTDVFNRHSKINITAGKVIPVFMFMARHGKTIFIGGFIGIILLALSILIIKNIVREYEFVGQLPDSDEAYSDEDALLQSPDAPLIQDSTKTAAVKSISKVSLIMLFVMLIPFAIAGIFLLINGIMLVIQGSPVGFISLGFAIIWVAAIVLITVVRFRRIRSAEKDLTGKVFYNEDEDVDDDTFSDYE